ncbi:nucleotide exchange factor GrpE [Candidatus Peregrinibacteria bacterium]|jgi:molecular chaperone GrpE|nr:nucleotide exchange factor GrpE [Candidatus Peregrinibacteria bacterium]
MPKDDKKQKASSQTSDDNQSQKNDDIDLDELLSNAQEESDKKEKAEEGEMTRDEEIEQYKQQALRAMADLQNVKKRMELEKQDFSKYASKKLLTSLLPILDNFKRAFSHIPEELQSHEWTKGIEQIEKNFIDILFKEGLEEVPSNSGDEFNADRHECLMQDPNEKDGKISQCLETGYMIKGKVLRPAKVSVGSK